MKIIFLVTLTLLTSCSRTAKINEGQATFSFKNGNADDTIQHRINIAKRGIISREYLQGVCLKEQDDNAIFRIDADSIYYVESLKSYKYEVRNDTLIINFEDWLQRSIINKLNADSLVLLDADDKSFTYLMRKTNQH